MNRSTVVICLWLAATAGPFTESSEPSTTGSPARTVVISIDDVPLGGGRWSGDDTETVQRINDGILEALVAHGSPGIGFVTEDRVQIPGQIDERVAILQSWTDAGIELGNHGYSHLAFQTTPLEQIQDDVIRGEVITTLVTGERPRFFRFPFNQTGPTPEAKASMRAFLESRGYTVAPFTVEHADYIYSAVYSTARRTGDEDLQRRALDAYLDHLDTAFAYAEKFSVELFGREIPQIFLIHANEINAVAMDEMLEKLERRGYTFTTLGEALKDVAYATDDNYVGRWGISWFHRWRNSRGLPMRQDEPDPPREILDAYRAITAEEAD
jgi:peptidoglycan/xylan/chitin deacetylase (PgdA/CDA1 family)